MGLLQRQIHAEVTFLHRVRGFFHSSPVPLIRMVEGQLWRFHQARCGLLIYVFETPPTCSSYVKFSLYPEAAVKRFGYEDTILHSMQCRAVGKIHPRSQPMPREYIVKDGSRLPSHYLHTSQRRDGWRKPVETVLSKHYPAGAAEALNLTVSPGSYPTHAWQRSQELRVILPDCRCSVQRDPNRAMELNHAERRGATKLVVQPSCRRQFPAVTRI
jgi:hypothetical protein